MPKVTKKLGNNKARAWESLGFAHKKKLCQHFDTTSKLIQLKICTKISNLELINNIVKGLAKIFQFFLQFLAGEEDTAFHGA